MADSADISPEVSVVVPTRDRPALLSRCLEALLSQDSRRAFEIIVVNDGRTRHALRVADDERVEVLHSGGLGPAGARNHGVAHARGNVIAFTDDDTVPARCWLDAAMRALDADKAAVGVEGPVESDQYDALYEYSVMNAIPGAYLTCNVAYRRQAVVDVGGFDESFPYPHCEDLDLGRRVRALGTILWSEDMRVAHPPRPISFRAAVRRAWLIESEFLYHRKHPETAPPRWPPRWGPLIRVARRWQRLVAHDRTTKGRPHRLLRALGIAMGQIVVASYCTLFRWPAEP